jgi:hypothetical protein
MSSPIDTIPIDAIVIDTIHEDKELRTRSYRFQRRPRVRKFRRGRAVACRLRDFHRQTHALITEHRIKNEIPGSKVERVSSGDPFML